MVSTMINLKNVHILSENDYARTMEHIVLPALAQVRTEGWMEPATHKDLRELPIPDGSHNGMLHYVSYTHSKSAEDKTPPQQEQRAQQMQQTADGSRQWDGRPGIVISHGITGIIAHYAELSYYFFQAGFDVWIMEHRGHGLSPHDVSDPSVIWIDDWRRYVLDLAKFTREVVQPHTAGALGLFAHSMGGGIGISLAQQYPELFSRIVLSSPMVMPQTAGFPAPLARAAARVFCMMGKGKSRIFTKKPFSPVLDAESVRGKSPARAQWSFDTRLADVRYQTSAPAYQWLAEAFALSRSVLEPENCARIQAPILLFKAENDTSVRLDAIEDFVDTVLSADGDIERVLIPHAPHTLNECRNDIFAPFVEKTLEFLSV